MPENTEQPSRPVNPVRQQLKRLVELVVRDLGKLCALIIAILITIGLWQAFAVTLDSLPDTPVLAMLSTGCIAVVAVFICFNFLVTVARGFKKNVARYRKRLRKIRKAVNAQQKQREIAELNAMYDAPSTKHPIEE